MVKTAFARLTTLEGCNSRWAGLITTAGLSNGEASSAATLGLFDIRALLDLFSRAPCSIHWLRRLISSSGMRGESGGMAGSSS